MTNLKKFRGSILILICLITLSTLLFGCTDQGKVQKGKQSHNNKIGSIDKDEIVSFKINNIIGLYKEIKSKSDRDKLIDLLNSVKIIKSGVEPVDGCGYSITITYSNGEKFSAHFPGTVISYSTSENNATWCEIDKNFDDILRTTYEETKVPGIDNAERKISEIVQLKYEDITKITFAGAVHKTIEDKESIKKIMNLIDQYTIKKTPQELPSQGYYISAQFFIDSKEAMNIDFKNPIYINGKSYEYKNSQLGGKTIVDFLNSNSF